MPASQKRCQPASVTNGSAASVQGCCVSSSRSGGRQDVASLLDTRHPKHTRGLSIAWLVGHHGGATMERAVGERVNERALARECVVALVRLSRFLIVTLHWRSYERGCAPRVSSGR